MTGCSSPTRTAEDETPGAQAAGNASRTRAATQARFRATTPSATGPSSLPPCPLFSSTRGVRKSESPTQECALADLPAGVPARVVSIDEERRRVLAAHGIRPAGVGSVGDDAPFGGPRIVRLGPARLAIARVVAAAIRVRPVPAAGAPRPPSAPPHPP